MAIEGWRSSVVRDRVRGSERGFVGDLNANPSSESPSI